MSHLSAAALLGIVQPQAGKIHVTVPPGRYPRRPGIAIHRRALTAHDVTRREGIPITRAAATLIDIAAGKLSDAGLERSVNEADRLDLIDPERLRTAAAPGKRRRGAPRLRKLLDRRTFALTDSELERRFLPIARRAGLPEPETGKRPCGFKVDFLWPDLRLIVETDGLRYHRTPVQQARDHKRDQRHLAGGYATLRFSHSQVYFEAADLERTLRDVSAGRT